MYSDDKILKIMGLGELSGIQRDQALNNILRTLHIRVGQRIIDLLDKEELTEFEDLLSTQDQAKVGDWLRSNIEDYDQLVAEELGKIKSQADETYTQIA
jgi:hypothetical protein